jgi:hypothetical protein
MKIPRITIFFLGALVGMVSCLPSDLEKIPTPTFVSPINHVIDYVADIDPIWTLDNVYIIWNEQDITMDAGLGKTCFLGDFGKRGFYKTFICLESQSGQLLWMKETGVHSTIAVTPNGIFIAYSSPGQLGKYDLKNGNLIWKKSLGRTGSIYLNYLDNQIQVATTNPETLWILDTNAEVISKIKGNRIFLSTKDETYVNLKGLQVLKTGTNQVLWEYIDMQHLTQAPLFTKDKIFLRNGDNFSGTAYALDRISGKLLWKVSNIIGNLIYSPDKQLVYALHEGGDLLAVDENTGKETKVIEFSPAPFNPFDGVETSAYQLAYDMEKQLVFVYLGDSRQLFGFKEK